MNFFHKIAIDRFHPSYVSGWCYHRFAKKKTLTLCLRVKDRIVSKTTANLFREDLLELGLHPTGKCGFELIIDPAAVCNGRQAYILTLEDSKRPLAVLNHGENERHWGQRIRGLISSSLSVFSGSRPRIVFMHIPKTAGTSFNTHSSKIFQRREISTHIELEDQSHYHILARDKKYLSGHLRFGVLKDFFGDQDFRFYTIVREPYGHLHSHLKWMIKTATSDSDNYFKYSNRVIYDLGRKLSGVAFDHASGIMDFVGNLDEVEARFFDNMQTRYFCDHEISRMTEVDFRQALDNTKRFSLIGLTEEYDSFFAKFIKQNSLADTQITRQLNRSLDPPLFDAADPVVRSALLPLVQYDLQLYEEVKKGW